MTKEEIKALISAKITGQGNQVDAGGALDTILNALVDLIPEGYELPTATAERLGGVKVGSRLSITEDGVLSASDQSYSLPAASAETLGGIKVGSNLSITEEGVLNAQGGGSDVVICELEDDAAVNFAFKTGEYAKAIAAYTAGKVVYLHSEGEEASDAPAIFAPLIGYCKTESDVEYFVAVYSEGLDSTPALQIKQL